MDDFIVNLSNHSQKSLPRKEGFDFYMIILLTRENFLI